MFWTVTTELLKGLGTTAELFGLTLLFALPLGLVVAFGSMSKWRPFRFLLNGENPGWFRRVFGAWQPISQITNFVVWVIRGTPLILQLIIIYYGPGLWFENNIWAFGSGRKTATVIAFVINYACYFSVIYRGGIEGVPKGQREAGQVLGMTRPQIFFKVTLLQMVKRILPPMSNEIITLVKDTSLARVVAITELIRAGEKFIKSAGIVWPLFYTAVFYLVFVGILTLLFNYAERKLEYFR